MLLPVLIEAGKELWSTYVKKLTDKAGDELATMTVNADHQVAGVFGVGQQVNFIKGFCINIALYMQHGCKNINNWQF